MLKGILILPAIVFLAACRQNIPQERLEHDAREAVRLFEEVCIDSGGNPHNVAAWAARQQLPVLDGEALKNLPLGMMELDAQAVWKVEKEGAVFYVSTAPGSCSVKTPRADQQAARRHFTALAEKDRAGSVGTLIADNGSSSPFPFNRLVYGRYESGAAEETVLTANTSSSEYAPAQLALYFTRRPSAMQIIDGR